MVKGVCTTTWQVKKGDEPRGVYAEHKKYHDAFVEGKPLTGYWHGPGLPARMSSYGTPTCGQLFLTSPATRLKHYQNYHQNIPPPAADEYVYKVGFVPKTTPSTPTPWGMMAPLGAPQDTKPPLSARKRKWALSCLDRATRRQLDISSDYNMRAVFLNSQGKELDKAWSQHKKAESRKAAQQDKDGQHKETEQQGTSAASVHAQANANPD